MSNNSIISKILGKIHLKRNFFNFATLKLCKEKFIKMTNQMISRIMITFIMVALLPFYSISAENDEETPQFKYADEQLFAFFDANRAISEQRRASNEEIQEVVEEHGLTLDRFNQISRAAQIGALQGGTFSDEEISAFNDVGPKINEIQRNLQMEVQVIIEEHGLTTSKYQEILGEYQQDQDLQEYVREILRERAIEARRQEMIKELEEEQRREAEEKEENDE